ncbi:MULTISPECIES: DUF411 domain-containing protein [unclassified Agarivorans]|uniref:DUF411 domain-containing protein n=1 Tax=unclassified Agarivorans TaxID=2636026 RepID=UPI0026E29750|nr:MULTISPECIES: DUF411 domain-containing protein [unclassified Agarivorans]MDO6686338.1 DUF411 domain-containing protein [Agarivorans sp. 3_MG-2023]MDO6713640.1 DUF411 domain-containing protein [Agarivorans sp. 2_MG-2023]MDO6761961.1 DUF411 domain-containing protein [Agarivorans sp. 1_MG-2023]
MMRLTRNFSLMLALLFSNALFAATTIELYKSPTCGCCKEWAAIMEQKGYTVNVHHQGDWTPIKKQYAMPAQLQSCHSAVIDGYLIEGHVPEADIARLLKERPANIKGLAAPGMPQHSPGMAKPGQAYKDFKVISFSEEGLGLYQQY